MNISAIQDAFRVQTLSFLSDGLRLSGTLHLPKVEPSSRRYRLPRAYE